MHRYRITNTPSAMLDQVIHVTDHLECGLSGYLYFAPLMFLQGPCFSTEAFLGLPKLKGKILVKTLSKYHRDLLLLVTSGHLSLSKFGHWDPYCNARIIVFPCVCTTFFLLFYTMFTMLIVLYCFFLVQVMLMLLLYHKFSLIQTKRL